ncbi:hypothetical protein CDD82_4211 [Ophiocordyceps australis]|uniref:AB hydrolase-1 domain-containing protein n=1 Tax=Ophiocordyceps australis TaxID=1399860 RepID=A0A2C5YD00_9HYPO|nr:hypothetical protein CDD82_4211 [Ophiocordyceps australis]
MMLKSAILLALASAVAAKRCREIVVPVDISSSNTVYDVATPRTEIDTTNFFLNLARQNSNYSATIAKGHRTIQGSYKLATTYCEPDSGPGNAIQIMTHGIGFDRSYWDYGYQNNYYSYINRAVEHGYSTLTWDRLGIGHSTHLDAISEAQIFLEVAALGALTQHVRDGKICDVNHRFTKLVHVGHSFGSVMTFILTQMDPGVTDAIVLTGYSQRPDYMAEFVLGGDFVPVSSLPMLGNKYSPGYVAPRTSVGVQTNFFAPGDFDAQMLKSATLNGQPAALGELLTLGAAGMMSGFGGAVQIVTGERDVPFCGGDCFNTKSIGASAPNLLESSRNNFANARNFSATVVPHAGHGLNFQYSCGVTYKAMLDFLHDNL